jgi:hypothetical protein
MKNNIIFAAVMALVMLGTGCAGSAPKPTANAPATSGPVNAAPDRTGQEKWDITLIFSDADVVLSGYPYIDKKMAPRLDNLIHIDTIVDDESQFPEKLTDPKGGWAPSFQYGSWSGMYESSRTDSRIFIPIGRSPANAPIWQTMEIVKQDDLAGLLPGCSSAPYELLDGLQAQKFTCQDTDATKTFAGNPPCFLPLDGSSGILYRQYSSDASTHEDMCGIMKANNIASATRRPF